MARLEVALLLVLLGLLLPFLLLGTGTSSLGLTALVALTCALSVGQSVLTDNVAILIDVLGLGFGRFLSTCDDGVLGLDSSLLRTLLAHRLLTLAGATSNVFSL